MSWIKLSLGVLCIGLILSFFYYRIHKYSYNSIVIEWCNKLDQEIDELVGLGFSESDSVVKRLRQMQKERLWCQCKPDDEMHENLENITHMQTKLLHDMQHTVYEFRQLNVPNDHTQLRFMQIQIGHESDIMNSFLHITPPAYRSHLDALQIQYKQAVAYYKAELRAYLMHGHQHVDEQVRMLKRKLAGNVKGYYRYARRRNILL